MDAPDSPELFEALGRGLSYLAGRIGTPWDAEVLRERMGKAQDTLGERLLFLLKRLRSIELAACAYASGQLRTSEGALIEQLRGHLVTGGVCTATRQSRNGIFVRTVEALSIFLASDLRLKSVTVVALHEGWNPGRLAWFLGATWNDLGDKLGVMAFDRAVDRLRSALLALSATVQAADGDINRLMQITQSMLDQRPRS